MSRCKVMVLSNVQGRQRRNGDGDDKRSTRHFTYGPRCCLLVLATNIVLNFTGLVMCVETVLNDIHVELWPSILTEWGGISCYLMVVASQLVGVIWLVGWDVPWYSMWTTVTFDGICRHLGVQVTRGYRRPADKSTRYQMVLLWVAAVIFLTCYTCKIPRMCGRLYSIKPSFLRHWVGCYVLLIVITHGQEWVIEWCQSCVGWTLY